MEQNLLKRKWHSDETKIAAVMLYEHTDTYYRREMLSLLRLVISVWIQTVTI
jgi:hypothetical protein